MVDGGAEGSLAMVSGMRTRWWDLSGLLQQARSRAGNELSLPSSLAVTAAQGRWR